MTTPAAESQAPLHLTLDGNLAIIELDNPPVNALYDTMREGIAELMPHLEHNKAVAGILFVGAGRAFSAGVDLKRTATRTEPFFLHAALDAMDRVTKPLFAAIHGAALGGGLELALTCHYRLAGAQARFGLPEVEVGIIPGACGTQRLPRIIPLARALDVAACGDILDTPEALRLGLVDETTTEADFRAAAIAWAKAQTGKLIRRTRDHALIASQDAQAIFAAAALRAAHERPGETAPLKAIAAVRAGYEHGFDAGVEAERQLVSECKYSAEAKAMRHLFFAERAAGKVAAPPQRLTALALSGSHAQTLAPIARAANIEIRPDAEIAVHVIGSNETAAPHALTVILHGKANGLVEIATQKNQDAAVLAAIARLVRPLGRATVIGRGCQLSQQLRAAVSGPVQAFSPQFTAALSATGEALVASGAAASTGDIDLLCVAALGFPRPLGGPIYQKNLSAS
ncbi:hypothetical protein GCM10010909_03790 [Acidocella aquatica]|uniref:Enoyl-CoA hydratase n=1 Tax=Acidocella aquatica TaxID=1922313 RepID=A0ABQ6A4A0_9PROT|nr:enoyl-CoA hydratase/isomerase family protein [Acidocella aquatica]GLR65701.1 hypothetical protein GCM10010909_03790 [Acidocella aquatica]